MFRWRNVPGPMGPIRRRGFGKRLLTRAGMLSIGPQMATFLDGIRNQRSNRIVWISRSLSARTISNAVIQHSLSPEGSRGIFEKAAGWLDVPAAIDGALQPPPSRRHHLPGHDGRAVDA